MGMKTKAKANKMDIYKYVQLSFIEVEKTTFENRHFLSFFSFLLLLQYRLTHKPSMEQEKLIMEYTYHS